MCAIYLQFQIHILNSLHSARDLLNSTSRADSTKLCVFSTDYSIPSRPILHARSMVCTCPRQNDPSSLVCARSRAHLEICALLCVSPHRCDHTPRAFSLHEGAELHTKISRSDNIYPAHLNPSPMPCLHHYRIERCVPFFFGIPHE